MSITGFGHWNGDTTRYCGRLELRADTQADAERLALLLRVLGDPEGRARLLEAAEGIEDGAGAELSPAFA